MHKFSILHILIIMASIYIWNNKNCNASTERDLLQDTIPESKCDGEFDYSRMILTLIPMFILFLNMKSISNMNQMLMIYAYIISLNALKNILNNSHNFNIVYPLIVTNCLLLIYWNITGPIYTYLYLLTCSIFELSRRYMNSTQLIDDLLYIHGIFYFTK